MPSMPIRCGSHRHDQPVEIATITRASSNDERDDPKSVAYIPVGELQE
jgi:hypothetical protein